MIFKSREEMLRYYRYLEYRDFCKKMSLWLLVPLFIMCIFSTVFTFMSLEMFRYNHKDCVQIERFCYLAWCIFAVVLIKGITKYKKLKGGRKYAVIFALSAVVTFLIANINMLIRFEPYDLGSYINSLMFDLSYDVGYGLLRYPLVYFTISRCAVVFCSEAYSRVTQSVCKYLRRFRWSRFEKKMIEIFSVTDDYNDQEG